MLQNTGTPAIPDEFGPVDGLGKPVRVFRNSRSSLWRSARVGVLLILIGLSTAFLLSVKLLPIAAGRTDLSSIFRLVCFFVLLAVLPLAPGGIQIGLIYFGRDKKFVVYENGFAFHGRKGLQVWRWEQVRLFSMALARHSLQGGWVGTSPIILTLQKDDGNWLIVDQLLDNVEELGTTIREKIFPFQRDALVESIERGEAVKLGALTLNNEQLAKGKQALPWVEIESVRLERGYLIFGSKSRGISGFGGGITVRAGFVPNLDAVLAVAGQLVNGRAEETGSTASKEQL